MYNIYRCFIILLICCQAALFSVVVPVALHGWRSDLDSLCCVAVAVYITSFCLPTENPITLLAFKHLSEGLLLKISHLANTGTFTDTALGVVFFYITKLNQIRFNQTPIWNSLRKLGDVAVDSQCWCILTVTTAVPQP